MKLALLHCLKMFLADYGMMWVGDKSLSSTDMSNGEDAVTDRVTVRDDMWSQGRWALLVLHGWVGGWVGGCPQQFNTAN